MWKSLKSMKLVVSVGLIIVISIFTLVITKDKTSNKIQANQDSNDENYITLTYDNESISFNKNAIYELKEYLENSSDPEIEIGRIKLTDLIKLNNNEYYIISYGGGIKLSNNLLLKKNEDGSFSSKLLSEASMYQNFMNSPNKKYIAFLFGRHEGPEVIRNDLVVVESITLETVEIDKVIESFTLPILKYIWLDNETLEIIVPDIKNTDFNTLDQWFKSKQKRTRKIVGKIH
ncbi:hypothetical protein R9X47_10290 [Wukongibacter baidiensis]|uniref:hypothetical protein n=1 Tax=Wukongibacter baidiensis TaxID=1723361 RepID=UPI003D7FFD33